MKIAVTISFEYEDIDLLDKCALQAKTNRSDIVNQIVFGKMKPIIKAVTKTVKPKTKKKVGKK